MIEYCDGIGFGREEDDGEEWPARFIHPEDGKTHVVHKNGDVETEETGPHVHSWLSRPWRPRDFPDHEIYDCTCGVRRFVPRGGSPNDVEDYPVLPFPESCPAWATHPGTYTTEPSLLLTNPPAPSRDAALPEKDYLTWPNESYL